MKEYFEYFVLIHLLFFLINIQDWSDFYGEDKIGEQILTMIARGENSVQTVFTKGCIYVKNSIFENITEAENGGGILINSTDSNSKFLIEDTQFNYCSALQSGGAVYAANSNIVMSRVCVVLHVQIMID